MSQKNIINTPNPKSLSKQTDLWNYSGQNSQHKMSSSSKNNFINSPGQLSTYPSSLQQSMLKEQLLQDMSYQQTPPLVSQFSHSQQPAISSSNSLRLSQKQISLNQSSSPLFLPSSPPILSNQLNNLQNNKAGSIETQASNTQCQNSSSMLSSKGNSPSSFPIVSAELISQQSYNNAPTQINKINSLKKQGQQSQNSNQDIVLSNSQMERPNSNKDVVQSDKKINNDQEQNNLKSSQTVQNTQGNRQDNSFCSSGSRRFSFFSKTSCATGVSQTYGASLFKRANQSAPRVNITNIIKKRAYLYLDEGLANTFDELLESGYNIVLNKKQERDEMKHIEEILKMELDQVQKDIAPLYQEFYKTQSQLQSYNDLYLKQISEHESLEKEIQLLNELIAQRQQRVCEEEQQLSDLIKQIEIENNNIRTEILLNKTTHKQEREQGEKAIKTHKLDLDKITEFLSEQKSIYEEKRQEQASRLRKMENKSKMYLGILKH
ncbi:hypothetical protein ABPG74_002933 [Tetrahymena malaccensis]